DKVVSYDTDANGCINKIEILEVFNGDTLEKTYNQNGKTFSSKAKEGFGITESMSMSICVPSNSGVEDDALLLPIKLNNGQPYSINAYDVDEASSIAGLVVITANMELPKAASLSRDKSEIAVLNKVSRVLDAETGDEYLKVNMLTKEGEKSYVVSPLMSSAVCSRFLNMNKGDVFLYDIIPGTTELKNCTVFQSINNYDGTGTFNVGTDREICLGTVSSCRYNYVSARFNRWTNSITIYDGSGYTTYEIYKTGTPPIFLIDEKGNATKGTFDDIQCGNKAYVGVVNNTVRVVVVCKWEA
ncbi:MAG: hypothetical protein UH854_06410, partial [Clostridia bacterium]|nr:hypothetical protein [Clostridia bacterium]